MIPLEQCAAILNKGKEKYDNEQVKIVRQYLYLLAELQIVLIKHQEDIRMYVLVNMKPM